MKGICFKEPLFHLTVQGIKTQTRRIVQTPKNAVGIQVQTRAIDGAFWGCFALNENEGTINPKTEQEWVINPRYKVGETVYLKEPYFLLPDDGMMLPVYKYGNDQSELWEGMDEFKWENKLFMPEKYARHFIKITAVRAERLQGISDEDCIKEGISQGVYCGCTFWGVKLTDGTYTSYSGSPREAYKMLIEKINGSGTWENNPWVWVYDYDLTNSPAI